MEARFHVPARDRVQGPRQPVAEAVAHLALVERLGCGLAVGVRRQVLRERLPEGRHAAAVGPFLRGVLAPGDAPQQLLGQAARLLGGEMAAAADGDAAVPRLPAAAPGAVVDDERLRARGLDTHPEADEAIVPGDPGLVGGLEVWTVRLVRVSLTLAVRLPVVVSMMPRGLAGGRKADSTQRQHLPSETRTAADTGEPVSAGAASTHR